MIDDRMMIFFPTAKDGMNGWFIYSPLDAAEMVFKADYYHGSTST